MDNPGRRPVIILGCRRPNILSVSNKRSFFPKRGSPNRATSKFFPHKSNFEILHQPFSALTKHPIHQLSDIREASVSSKAPTAKKEGSVMLDGADTPMPCTPEAQRVPSPDTTPSEYMTPLAKKQDRMTDGKGLGPRATSAMSLPLRDVPERRSSASIFAQSGHTSRKGSLPELLGWQIPPDPRRSKAVSLRGRSDSPVRQAMYRSAQSSDSIRRSPSRTFIRTTPPLDILEKGSLRNDRVDLSVYLPSPMFVGGGTVEGHIKLNVHDDNNSKKSKAKTVSISRLSLDVIGVEETSDGRRWVFLSLGSELLDENYPPPPALVQSQLPRQGAEFGWNLRPASAIIPFCVNLPLNLGPPPYLSKHASIRYILCPTAHLKIGDKRSLIRQTWHIQMLTVHDPQKALASLPSPLLASDSLTSSHGADIHVVKLTAGLHRQTWVNGSKIFVDVHVVNGTPKSIKKLELQLEKTMLCYSHAAAGTAEKSATHLRLPRKSDSEIVSSLTVRKSKTWKGVGPQTSEVRTLALEVPKGHVTISTGRYFEIRYFINIIVSVSMFKSCTVQLPVSLIHMNSLDILPNSLAQVAASIEAKRARTLPISHQQVMQQQYHQGQAFIAPGRQSLEKSRKEGTIASNDISLLTEDLDNSPRLQSTAHRYVDGHQSVTLRRENLAPSHPSNMHHNHKRHPSCYYCHLLYDRDGERPGTAMSMVSQTGLRLPRLQVSTSGLGFSESEFEVPADSPPRKVMLSERERKMINQQRELKMQRQWSQRNRQPSTERGGIERSLTDKIQPTFKHVVPNADVGPKQPGLGNLSETAPFAPQLRLSRRADSKRAQDAVGARSRSKTDPEVGLSAAGPSKYQRIITSMDSPRKDFRFPGRDLKNRL
jgi:Arrestin (or S-antigen), C-terminal domain